jgi:hypothetical protein
MNFLFPTFLFGLSAIAIPIIIHLFNFRKYKKIYFTNVQFLKELKQESDSKSKLKEWIILLLRILAISCLVVAFAQPFIPSDKKVSLGQKIVSVYVDNSFSMENINKKGTLLENAKQYATTIVNSYNSNDKFQLITNDFEGKHQRLLTKEEFISQLEEVKISSSIKQINDVINRQQDFLRLNNCKNKHLFLLSDFQKNVSGIQKSIIDTSILIRLIPIVSSEINNVYIDSVWFENPVQQFNTSQTLHAIVVNKSNKEIVNGSLKLIINGKQMSINSFDIEAENKKDVSISFKVKDNGINNGVLKIEDYPIAYDDDFYFSFNAKSTINVLVINGKENKTGASFKSLMQNDSLFLFHESVETEIDYGIFSKLNMIVLNDLENISSGLTMELQKFINQGGSLVVFPKPPSDFRNYNLAFQNLHLPQIESKDSVDTKTQSINFEQGLFEGVFEKVNARMDMPKIREHYVFKGTASILAEPILMLQNGQSLLSQYSFGKGKVYLFSIASNDQYSNFIKHALFVPTIIKIGVLSLKPISLYYETSANQSIEMNTEIEYKDKPLHITKINSTIDLIPEQKVINNKTMLFTQNQIAEAGHYIVSQLTHTISGIAFNFNRKESDMNFYSAADLQSNIEGLNLKNVTILSVNESSLMSAIKETNSGDKLWKLFIILALVFLLIEVIVIRLFK